MGTGGMHRAFPQLSWECTALTTDTEEMKMWGAHMEPESAEQP